jgi:hypothetical protein
MQSRVIPWAKALLRVLLIVTNSVLMSFAQESNERNFPLPKCMRIRRSLLNHFLEQVEIQARHYKLRGWPEINSDSRFFSGPDLKDPLLNSIWAQTNKVIWHYRRETNTWDAVVVLQRTDNRWYPDEQFGKAVYIKNAFGNVQITPLADLPYLGLSISRVQNVEVDSGKQLPPWVGYGKRWAFTQEDDAGEIEPIEGIFHSGFGFGWLLNSLETKSEHNEFDTLDRLRLAEVNSKQVDSESDSNVSSQHSCSGIFAEDLIRAERVRTNSGWVWFHLNRVSGISLSDFVVRSEVWSSVRTKVPGIRLPSTSAKKIPRLNPQHR